MACIGIVIHNRSTQDTWISWAGPFCLLAVVGPLQADACWQDTDQHHAGKPAEGSQVSCNKARHVVSLFYKQDYHRTNTLAKPFSSLSFAGFGYSYQWVSVNIHGCAWMSTLPLISWVGGHRWHSGQMFEPLAKGSVRFRFRGTTWPRSHLAT